MTEVTVGACSRLWPLQTSGGPCGSGWLNPDGSTLGEGLSEGSTLGDGDGLTLGEGLHSCGTYWQGLKLNVASAGLMNTKKLSTSNGNANIAFMLIHLL